MISPPIPLVSPLPLHQPHRLARLLFEELEQGDLFGGSQKQVKGRMSFFKRLSWQKGSPGQIGKLK